MVIALDNYRQKGISLDEHRFGGLFGELHVYIRINTNTGENLDQTWARVDDGSPLAGGRNKHVSAVLALLPAERFDTFDKADDFSIERKMRVRILHNRDAGVPLPRDVFNDADDEHLN